MQLLFDLHTHTVASGHAFSTWKENIEEAAKKGLMAVGCSDHCGAALKAPGALYFGNCRAVAGEIMGVRVFTGIEANIIDYKGTLDMGDEVLAKLDYVIASLHVPCIPSGTREENTSALIGAMKNPWVKIIGHPDDDRFLLDHPRLVDAAARYKVALEINSSSMSARTGRKNADKNIPRLLELCRQYRVPVIAGSDAHIWYDVGNMKIAEKLLEECSFPEELVLNTRMENLDYIVNQKEKLEFLHL